MNKKIFLTTSLIILALTKNVIAAETPVIRSVTAGVKVATEYCHGDTDAAHRKAREYCAQYGYREDECTVLSKETISEERIHEPTGTTYSDGDMMYYQLACTAEATFKMEHKPLGLYNVVFPEGPNLYSNFQIHTFSTLNAALGTGINFRLEDIVDPTHTTSHMEFHMSVNPNSVTKEFKLGKICIPGSDAYQLDEVRTISNDNFTLNLNYRETSGIFDFDGCKWNEVPLTGTIKLNRLPNNN
ncbi:MAG: hypothetical protein ACXVCY_14535 [Pseudobdellovibrionaceae bacterium]